MPLTPEPPFLPEYETPVQQVTDPLLRQRRVRLLVKRLDKVHPAVAGNKFWKLKYNLLQARNEGHHTLLTFGGAFSNHIYATAAAARAAGFGSVGIIRGEAHLPLNSTLQFARDNGMRLHYMDRTTYRHKHTSEVLEQLATQFGKFYLIPEGGSNALAVKGCREMALALPPADFVCTACGTGGTMAGLVAANLQAEIAGFPVLKGGGFLQQEVENLLLEAGFAHGTGKWHLQTGYHFGGYARQKPALTHFIEQFEVATHIPLEFVYTGKMLFGVIDLVKQGFFPAGSTVLALHTGGLR